jgi:hypothetical protein
VGAQVRRVTGSSEAPDEQDWGLLVELGDARIQAGDVAGRPDQPGEVDPVSGRDLDRAGPLPARGRTAHPIGA